MKIPSLIPASLLILSGTIIIRLARATKNPMAMLYGIYLIIGTSLVLVVELFARILK